MSEECGRKSAEVDELGLDLEKERRRRRKLQRDVQEAAVTLTHILTVKLQVGCCSVSLFTETLMLWSVCLQDSEDTAQTHRMQRLLEILESPAPPGTSPAPSPGKKPQTSSPKPDRYWSQSPLDGGSVSASSPHPVCPSQS